MKCPNMNDFDHVMDFAYAKFKFLKENKGLSLRQANKLAGFSSPNYMLLLFQKQRMVGSKAAAEGIAKALEFTEQEHQAFCGYMLNSFMEQSLYKWNTKTPHKVIRNRKVPDFKGKLLAAVHALGQEDEF